MLRDLERKKSAIKGNWTLFLESESAKAEICLLYTVIKKHLLVIRNLTASNLYNREVTLLLITKVFNFSN